MEKFAKWDDPSNGLNAFAPHEIKAKPMNAVSRILRRFLSVLLVTIRLPCVLMALVVGAILHFWKYCLVIPALVRAAERFIDGMIGKLLLSVTSFNNLPLQYHREHKDFDFVKFQKHELTVTEVEGDVYVCNQTCFADWVWLMMKFSPIFTKIVVVEKKNGETKVGLRALSAWESIWHAMGIQLPETVSEESPSIFYHVKDMMDANGLLWYRGRRPIVIHPEGTKTNGLGVLNIDNDIRKMIVDAAGLAQNLRVHAIRFDHTWTRYSAYNTTDQSGLSSARDCLTQFTSKMIIQYYFNMEGVLHDCQNDTDRGEFIKRCLMIRRKEQCMKHSSWREHQEFLKCWQETDFKQTSSKKNQ